MRGLNFLIALSSFGNIIAVQVGLSRQIRECGRQGVLPFTRFWVSTRPFGTPLGPYAVVWFMIALMTLAVPAGNAFTFVNDLSMLPKAAFNFAIAVGIYVYPPDGGQYVGDVSFWYATYAVTGVGIACAIYYALWAHFTPNWKGYNLRQELITLEDGAQSNRLRKVPNEEVEERDAVHVAGGAPY
ncbi:hypothetical protein AN9379.2 [Aspergillus nidulans FGSC A4]|uniref:Amino acid transporter, partial (Eurofung) n=1 Tax=Emericella nidulans (strain FGSC A4 / ATCC 38163 / CBS 112.46 / NRRL 194 / M139) TaxID=227321 RepID=Q5AQQ1_EMENI|eukprot:XP_682648.1 hypothetical protein AN9379.2 [Aspergillus nidulans FGSC A4]